MQLHKASSGEHKLDSYYGAYDRHFPEWKDKTFKLLEIGIQGGGSLRMWRKYFPNAEVWGTDIDPHCAELDVSGATVIIGDQSDPEFLKQFTDFDIIIDDGGHTMNQQKTSFDVLFPLLNPGGLYVIEDLHTSYWPAFWDKDPKMTDYLKELVDDVNREALKSQRAQVDASLSIKRPVSEVHFYPSMCFIKKI